MKEHDAKPIDKSMSPVRKAYIGGILTIIGFAVLGYHTVKTYQAASSAYQHWHYLQNKAQTAGDTRRFQKLPPDELNFAKTPVWEEMAYMRKPTKTPIKQRFERFALPENGEIIGDFSRGLKCNMAAIQQVWNTDRKVDPMHMTNSAVDVHRQLLELEPEMEELRLASRRPYAACMPLIFSMVKPSERIIDQNHPHIRNVRSFCHLFSVHASSLLALKRPEEAFIDFQVINKIAVSLENHSSPSAIMLRAGALERAIQVFWEGLVKRDWTTAQLQAFSNSFQGINFLKNLDEVFGYGEATYLRCQIDYSFLNDRIFFAWLIRPHLLDLTKIHELCLTAYDSSRLQVYPQISNRCAPNLKAILRTMAFTQTSIHQAAIACALAQYHQAHARYPENLTQLTPDFLKQAPQDITTGRSLIYHRTLPDQYVLYSVGWNQTDDGGITSKGPERSNEDWVWFSSVKE